MPAENDKTSSYVVGVDFGGTKILAGVFDEKFNCIGRARVSTKADRGVDEVIGRIARSVREAVDEIDLDLKQIKAIGIGLARLTWSHPRPRSEARPAAVPNSEAPITPKVP